MKIYAALLACCALALPGCSSFDQTSPNSIGAEAHPEARLYDALRNAKVDVDAALLSAEAGGKLVMIVMGANWCHDSRAFAGWTETPKIGGLIREEYELVFVNVGMPQTKDGHNLDVAERFGIEVVGTPTVLIVSPIGEPINADTAGTWRNAATRSEDEIYDELAGYANAVG
ncbi:hypothetical protein GCM10023115_08410 [Pontixanthobacter gangjinensis]|uniref:Thioredoxin family protein n=1 Tax=Pontixanthobacter gangjinensis TaxID=1028742 RepID=A0A6I4SMP1_9SPHN|nr:thioredoxin family protein [Pontixanthobacter gangjinensis]MXO56087.1 thioredoxin family protein [Pontixanthobacter gangjinensis]